MLRVLEKYYPKVKAAFLVGTPIGVLPIKNYDSDKIFLTDFSFDWEKIKNHCKKFFIYHSDNDPYVSFENGKQLAKNLDAELTFIPNAGHFNKSAGYITFEKLFKDIKKEI